MMDARCRLVLVVVSVVIVVAIAAYLVFQLRDGMDVDEAVSLFAGFFDATLFFRSMADEDYGQVAYLGSREGSMTRHCDRIDVLADRIMVCMAAEVSVLSCIRLSVLDPDGTVVDSWKVPGVPSWVRFFFDGFLVVSTTFVVGHFYLQAGFSTSTQVYWVGRDDGDEDLEDYTLVLDGEEARSVDCNYWGVIFVDDRTFYVTLRSGDSTWLVEGDREERTLITLRTDVECFLLSPDGMHLVYKKRFGYDGVDWTLALLDLRSGEERLLGERRSVDDQVEWLDDRMVLYALLHEDRFGRSDVWELGMAQETELCLLVEDAVSLSVMR